MQGSKEINERIEQLEQMLIELENAPRSERVKYRHAFQVIEIRARLRELYNVLGEDITGKYKWTREG